MLSHPGRLTVALGRPAPGSRPCLVCPSSMIDPEPDVARSAQVLIQQLGPERRPRVAVLLGSGWGAVAERVADPLDIPYASLPAFPAVSIAGHAASVRSGRLGGREVLLLRGRRHAYEGGDASAMKGAVRTLAAVGVRILIQTNAAGSLAAAMQPGQVMLLTDHLNMVQHSPLLNERDDSRFVSMVDAYDPALRACARMAARSAGIGLHEGVYAWVLGPQFETPAEIRMLAQLGAQAVGMSTVPETILARHAGLRVLALSLITNMAAGLGSEVLSHAHTLHTAAAAAEDAARLLEAVITATAAADEGAGAP